MARRAIRFKVLVIPRAKRGEGVRDGSTPHSPRAERGGNAGFHRLASLEVIEQIEQPGFPARSVCKPLLAN